MKMIPILILGILSAQPATAQAPTFREHWLNREEVANGLAASALLSGLQSKRSVGERLAWFTAVSCLYELYVDRAHADSGYHFQARRDVFGREVGYLTSEFLIALWRTLH